MAYYMILKSEIGMFMDATGERASFFRNTDKSVPMLFLYVFVYVYVFVGFVSRFQGDGENENKVKRNMARRCASHTFERRRSGRTDEQPNLRTDRRTDGHTLL